MGKEPRSWSAEMMVVVTAAAPSSRGKKLWGRLLNRPFKGKGDKDDRPPSSTNSHRTGLQDQQHYCGRGRTEDTSLFFCALEKSKLRGEFWAGILSLIYFITQWKCFNRHRSDNLFPFLEAWTWFLLSSPSSDTSHPAEAGASVWPSMDSCSWEFMRGKLQTFVLRKLFF